jgi:hypothetical protein
MFVAEGRVLQGVNMSLVGTSHKPELYRVSISMVGVELSKMVSRIQPRA